MSNLTELVATLDGIEAGDFNNDVDRLRLIETVKKLLGRVETGEERMYDITFTQPVVFAALETLLDLGLWKKWTEVGGVSRSVHELCELCAQKCDLNLLRMTAQNNPEPDDHSLTHVIIGRLLKLLASVHIIAETHEDHFALTNIFLGSSWQWIAGRYVHTCG